jgi:LPXTG-motif cell wall-anchored protein
MRRSLMLAAVATLFALGWATLSFAGPMELPCCGCVNASSPQQPVPAAFCGYFPGAAHEAAVERCLGINNTMADELICFAANASDCRETLAANDIACPPETGAPAASSSVLAVLVALLGAAGYFAARRRA